MHPVELQGVPIEKGEETQFTGKIPSEKSNSVTAVSFGMSMAIHPPVSQFLIDQYGWKYASTHSKNGTNNC